MFRRLRVGQVTLTERPTGCTVILADGGATGAVDVRGGAPARVRPICSPLTTP